MSSVHLIEQNDVCRLIFRGSLTHEHAPELENRIIDALRRHTRFEVDLAGVQEIDLCGIHLLRILETVAGDTMTIVNDSLIVERARERLLTTTRASWLRARRPSADDRFAAAA